MVSAPPPAQARMPPATATSGVRAAASASMRRGAVRIDSDDEWRKSHQQHTERNENGSRMSNGDSGRLTDRRGASRAVQPAGIQGGPPSRSDSTDRRANEGLRIAQRADGTGRHERCDCPMHDHIERKQRRARVSGEACRTRPRMPTPRGKSDGIGIVEDRTPSTSRTSRLASGPSRNASATCRQSHPGP